MCMYIYANKVNRSQIDNLIISSLHNAHWAGGWQFEVFVCLREAFSVLLNNNEASSVEDQFNQFIYSYLVKREFRAIALIIILHIPYFTNIFF